MNNVIFNKLNERRTLPNLQKRTSLRHKHIANVLYQNFKSAHLNQYTLFSIAFIWHCHKYLNIKLFDNFCDEEVIYNMLWTYPTVSNKHQLESFIKLSNVALKKIPKSYIQKAVRKFEEDNGEFGDIPHGFIASNYNVKHLLDNFTESMSFNINNDDVSLIVNKLNLFL